MSDWEPVKPTLEVATNAYQVLLELARAHPEDPRPDRPGAAGVRAD